MARVRWRSAHATRKPTRPHYARWAALAIGLIAGPLNAGLTATPALAYFNSGSSGGSLNSGGLFGSISQWFSNLSNPTGPQFDANKGYYGGSVVGNGANEYAMAHLGLVGMTQNTTKQTKKSQNTKTKKSTQKKKKTQQKKKKTTTSTQNTNNTSNTPNNPPGNNPTPTSSNPTPPSGNTPTPPTNNTPTPGSTPSGSPNNGNTGSQNSTPTSGGTNSTPSSTPTPGNTNGSTSGSNNNGGSNAGGISYTVPTGYWQPQPETVWVETVKVIDQRVKTWQTHLVTKTVWTWQTITEHASAPDPHNGPLLSVLYAPSEQSNQIFGVTPPTADQAQAVQPVGMKNLTETLSVYQPTTETVQESTPIQTTVPVAEVVMVPITIWTEVWVPYHFDTTPSRSFYRGTAVVMPTSPPVASQRSNITHTPQTQTKTPKQGMVRRFV